MDRTEYQYFTDNDFYEIIGEHLDEKLSARAIDNSSSYFITYTSTLIKNRIEEMSAKRLYKEDNADGSYELYIGLIKEYATKLTKEQKSGIILACIYQADYILDNGSPERMSAIGLVNRSNKYNKSDLKEFEICSISQNILDNLGLTYMGIGGGVYAMIPSYPISISIAHTPIYNYTLNQPFNPTNGKLLVKYNDGTSKIIDITYNMIENFNTSTVGNKVAILSYMGTTCDFGYIVE